MRKTPEAIKITARKLRKQQTNSENIIWELVKDRKIGYKIQRQFPLYVFTENSWLHRYIIPDFYCSEKKAIIEIDGNIHEKEDIYLLDTYKETILISSWYSVLRIKNVEIISDRKNTLKKILSFLNALQPLSLEKREDSGVSLWLCEKRNSGVRVKSGFIMLNESFTCENCGKEISKHPSGSARNHCPHCLYSKHLDKDFPWDRLSECHGLMKPIWKDYHKNKSWMVINECLKCWKNISNKLAEDDNVGVYGKL